MGRRIGYLLAAVSAVLMISACKPTEHNYSAAYNLALQKQTEGLDDDIAKMIKAESLPPMRRLGNDSIRVTSASFVFTYAPATADTTLSRQVPREYNVAVGKYKMLTNAKAHADRLSSSGRFRDAHVIRTGVPEYFTVICATDSLSRAAHEASKFREYGEAVVGLPEPIAIISIRK